VRAAGDNSRPSRWAGAALVALLIAPPAPGRAGEFDVDLQELYEISPRPGAVIASGNFEQYAHLFDPDFGKFVAGGFVDIDEDLDRAARRELKEETGVSVSRLRQIGAYGRVGRDPRGRTVSVAFLGIWPGPGPTAMAGDDAAASEWRSPDRLRRMAFDHARILQDGRAELASVLREGDEALLELLPRSFTLEGVAAFLGAWTGRRPRPATLRRKWLASGSIAPAGGRRSESGAAASPMRYRHVRKTRGGSR